MLSRDYDVNPIETNLPMKPRLANRLGGVYSIEMRFVGHLPLNHVGRGEIKEHIRRSAQHFRDHFYERRPIRK